MSRFTGTRLTHYFILIFLLALGGCLHENGPEESQKPARFLEHWIKKDTALTVVMLGDSLSTSTAHTTKFSAGEQQQRPPMLISHNLPSAVFDILARGNLQYRRFDSPGVFRETGKNWRSYFGYPRGLGTDDEDCRPGETHVQEGRDEASVSFVFPAGMGICNFIYRTTVQGNPGTLVAIGDGKDLVEVFNAKTRRWVEADHYTFSMRQTHAGPYSGNTRYQERLKLRRKTPGSPPRDATVTVTKPAADTSTRLAYWGIEYCADTRYVSLINEARGGADILDLRSHINDSLDGRDADLVIFQVPLMNMMNRKARTPQQQWDLFYDLVLSEKPYSLRSKSDNFSRFELVVWIPYEKAGFIKADGTWRDIYPGDGKRYSSLDYHRIFSENLKDYDRVSFIDIYTAMTDDAFRLYGNPYLAFKKGALTTDGVHLNDTGTALLAGHLLSLFKVDSRK
jgi:hypothetical protein